jgi:ribonuclease HII
MLRPVPDMQHETTLGGVVAGIDEAGRGPWAGPVVAAAVVFATDCDVPEGIHDSKALTTARREVLFETLTTGAGIHVGVGRADPAEIDDLNILQATFLAMTRAFTALPVIPDCALVDGNRPPPLACAVHTLVKGDAKSLSIAAASIVAKVTRDREMTALADEFPGYGWERNAGYGTAQHKEAIGALGITPHHRKSFAPIRQFMAESQAITP